MTNFYQVTDNAYATTGIGVLNNTTSPVTITGIDTTRFEAITTGYIVTIWDSTLYPDPTNDPNMEKAIITAATISASGSLTLSRANPKAHVTSVTIGVLVTQDHLRAVQTSINANETAIATKEPAITAGTSSQYYRGDKTFQTLNQDAVPSGTTNKAYTATEQTKLAGVATGATANSSDIFLLSRTNHTGTQSADTLTDGTTNKAFLATERTKLSGIATGATANSPDATLLARANHTGTQLASTISDFSTAADARITAATGVSVASLSGGKVPTSQLPAVSLTSVQTASSQVAQLALTTQEGDVVVRTDENKTYMRNAGTAGTMADFTLLNTPPDAVTSVNGQTGIVSLAKADVGLSNVDNTSDLSKPISTATQTALNAKEGTITAGTTGQYWRGDKTFQTLDKTAVGLANVDNTSDVNKPVSTAQQTALDAKVAGPTSSTDKAIARFNGTTGKIVQNSGVTVNDSGVITLQASDATNNTQMIINAPAPSAPSGVGSEALRNEILFKPQGIGTAANKYGYGIISWYIEDTTRKDVIMQAHNWEYDDSSQHRHWSLYTSNAARTSTVKRVNIPYMQDVANWTFENSTLEVQGFGGANPMIHANNTYASAATSNNLLKLTNGPTNPSTAAVQVISQYENNSAISITHQNPTTQTAASIDILGKYGYKHTVNASGGYGLNVATNGTNTVSATNGLARIAALTAADTAPVLNIDNRSGGKSIYVQNNGTETFSVTSTGNATMSGLKVTTSPTSGHVLTADASGNATWQAPTGSGTTWGSITGTLSSQSDLNTALTNRVTKSGVNLGTNDISVDIRAGENAFVSDQQIAFVSPGTYVFKSPTSSSDYITIDSAGISGNSTSTIRDIVDPTNLQDATTKNYVDTGLAGKLSTSGGTMASSIDMGTYNTIINVADPVNTQDVATKNYVDNKELMAIAYAVAL